MNYKKNINVVKYILFNPVIYDITFVFFSINILSTFVIQCQKGRPYQVLQLPILRILCFILENWYITFNSKYNLLAHRTNIWVF